MPRLTPAQLAELAAELTTVNPAAPELLMDEARRAHSAIRFSSGKYAKAGQAQLTVLRRLLDVETELATTRAAVARVVYDGNDGDDVNMSDLMWELEQAGVSIRPELDEVEAVRLAQIAAMSSR